MLPRKQTVKLMADWTVGTNWHYFELSIWNKIHCVANFFYNSSIYVHWILCIKPEAKLWFMKNFGHSWCQTLYKGKWAVNCARSHSSPPVWGHLHHQPFRCQRCKQTTQFCIHIWGTNTRGTNYARKLHMHRENLCSKIIGLAISDVFDSPVQSTSVQQLVTHFCF